METREAHGETTLVVDTARLVEACLHLRDSEGFSMLADVTPTDYLGWGERGVAGYIGTSGGRDLNAPGSQGHERLPESKRKRFSMNYHLVAVPGGQLIALAIVAVIAGILAAIVPARRAAKLSPLSALAYE